MAEYTKVEIRDLIIAFIALTICFSIATAGLNVHAFISCLPIVMLV